MPSIREKQTKDGRVFFEIQVSRGRSRSRLTTRWYAPVGWSRKAIDRELMKVAAEFERRVDNGEALSRAEAKEIDLLQKQEAAKIQTLHQYAERVFMPAKTVTISENSRSSFQGNLDRWIYPALGDLRMPDITAANISALLLDIQAQGKAHATVIKVYTVLNSLFKMAYLSDVIPKNPMDKVERPKQRKDDMRPAEPEAYTIEEVQHIFACLEKEPLKWQALIRLLVDTGIRRGECCGLQWKDIDFTENTITIAGNLCYTAKKGVYLDVPKNGKTRTIDVDPDVLGLLQQLRGQQVEHNVISPFVFTQNSSAEPMHPQTPTRYLKKFSERYGIDDLHPHKLRHSFASIAITNGADIASVSEKLGHSDKAVTLRMYTHADQESMKRAAAITQEAIKKAGQG